MTLGNVDLTQELVQAVRDTVDIVDIAGEQTRLTRKGNRWEGLCPLHKEKTPSFSVDRDRGLFYCFGCGAGGDAIKLHMQLSGDDFPAAIESLALRYGIPMRSRRTGSSGQRRDGPDIAGALAATTKWFTGQLGQKVPSDYLRERRISPELAERFGLGYAPDGWETLTRALAGKPGSPSGATVKMPDLIAAGLAAPSKRSGEPYSRFRHRLIFPIHNASGRLVGFGGRTLGDDKAKYVNTAETERFHKSMLLYGLYQSRRDIRDSGRAILTEGYFDVLAVAAAGIEGAVASMGTSLTPEQARLIARYAEEVVVAYDDDAAGEKAYRRALPLLLTQGLAVYRAQLGTDAEGKGHDPDSLRLERGETELARRIADAPDAVTAEIERLAPPAIRGEPHRTAQAAAAIGDLLAAIPDSVLRYAYSRRAADRLDVPVEVLRKRVRPGRRDSPGRRGGGPPGGRPGFGGPGTDGSDPGAPRPGGSSDPRSGRSEGGPETAPRRPSPVRNLEERVLQHLLLPGAEPPAAADLPDPEAFLDAECRNIFRVFCDLYTRRGEPPDARAVLDGLGREGSAVDRLASLLLEESFGSGGFGTHESTLPEALRGLQRRWEKQRLRQLQREIVDAARQGNDERLDRLKREKTRLSLRHQLGSEPAEPRA